MKIVWVVYIYLQSNFIHVQGSFILGKRNVKCGEVLNESLLINILRNMNLLKCVDLSMHVMHVMYIIASVVSINGCLNNDCNIRLSN